MTNLTKMINNKLNIIYMIINFLIFNLFITKLNVVFSKSLVDQAVFGIILIFIPFFILDKKKIKLLKDYNKVSYKLGILLISIWIAFSLIGSNLFFEDINRFLISKIVCLGLLSFAMIPLVIFILYLFEYFKNKNLNTNKKLPVISNFKENIILLSISLVFTALIYFFFAPGLISPDTFVQWLEAIGHQRIGDGGSALLAILYRPFAMLFIKPEVYLAFQTFVFSFITGKIILYFKDKINYKILILFWVVFMLFPGNFVYSFTLWKDVPYTLILFINTYFLIRYFRKDLDNKLWFLFGVTNALMYFFRHNGKVVTVFLILYFLIFLILKREKKYLYFLLTSILIILFISKVIFPWLKVVTRINNGNSPITSILVHTYSKILKDGHKVDKNIEKVMSKYAEKKQYVNLYNKYNIDYLAFDLERVDKYNGNIIYFKESLDVYFYLLKNYPKYVIYERFYGTDLLWNMSMSKESFNYVFVEGAELLISKQSEYEIYKKIDSRVKNEFTYLTPRYKVGTKYFDTLRHVRDKFNTLNNIFFRSGMYLNIFWILCLFIIKNNKKYLIVTSVFVFNTLTWMALMLHQSYRYVWYVPILVILLVISTVIYIKEQKVYE